MVVTFGFVALFVFHEPTKQFAYRNPAIFWVALVVLLVTMICMACCESVRRQTPMNFIFLGLFTLAESFLMGVSASRYAPNEVSIWSSLFIVIFIKIHFFSNSLGTSSSRNYSSRLFGSNTICHPNQIWLYHVRRCFTCGYGHIPCFRYCGHIHQRKNHYIGLCIHRCTSLLYLPHLRHSAYDGRRS